MPSDMLPKPAVQSPILDRFRFLLRERDNEFIDSISPPPPPTTDEIVAMYEDVLSELTFNSKPIITDLTILAGDYRDHAEGIADLICARILEVTLEQKLPSLYLLDSIVKNIGRDYVRHFASRLPEVFCLTYRQVPQNLHSSMRHLFGTWLTVFPSPVLREIEDELLFSPRVNQPSPSLTGMRSSESPRPSHGIHVNPKYLEARRQFDNVSAKNNVQLGRGASNFKMLGQKHSIGFDDYDYEQGEGSDAQRYRISEFGGRTSFPPLSDKMPPSVSGPGRPLSPSVDEFAMSNSPGRFLERASPSHYGRRVRGREEETVDWQKRHCTNDFLRGRENVASYNLSNGFDHDRPRALIDAYGQDDGNRSYNEKPVRMGRQILNGAVTKVVDNSWQNTEEEEYNWEDMSPTLVDGKTSNYTQSSTLPMRSTLDSNKAAEDAIQSQDGVWNLPGTLGAAVQKLPVPGTENTSQLNLAANGMRAPSPARAPVSTGLWPPSSSHSVMPMPPLYPQQNQSRPSFEFMNSSYTILNQGPQQLGSNDNRNPISVNPAHRPQLGFASSQHPPRPPVSLPPHLFTTQDHRHNAVSTQVLLPPASLGYTQLGQGGAAGNVRNNAMPVFRPSPPFQNVSNGSIQFQAPMQPVPSGPRPYGYMPPHFQTNGRVANQPSSAALSGLLNSGLLNSLVAQGLLPSMKQTSDQDSLGPEFNPDLLKVRHESAIRALYEVLPRQCTTCGLRFKTQEEHSKHMDWHVTKNRVSKNRKHNPSRQWFVKAAMWLSGAETLGTEATPGFLPAQSADEKKDDEEMSVPADEDQSACALCGEPFEDYYSDETEEWMYRGAVYLNTPYGGSTVGMGRSQLGPIVHAKCRSDSSAAPC